LRESREGVRRSGLLLVLVASGACATVLGIEAPESRDASSDDAAADAPRDQTGEGAVDVADAAHAADAAADVVQDARPAAPPDAPADAPADANGADVVTSAPCDPTKCGLGGTCCAMEDTCRTGPTACSMAGFYACRGNADCPSADQQQCCGQFISGRWTFRCIITPTCNGLTACQSDGECVGPGTCRGSGDAGCPDFPLKYCGGC
jgi:hypothetical protein